MRTEEFWSIVGFEAGRILRDIYAYFSIDRYKYSSVTTDSCSISTICTTIVQLLQSENVLIRLAVSMTREHPRNIES